MANTGTNAAPLIGTNYIRDNKLLEMTQFAFAGSDATKVNIYIDLNSILSGLITPNYNLAERVSDYEIASSIINMIAHYRAFFWRKLQVETKFFLVYGYGSYQFSSIYYPEYYGNFKTNIIYFKPKLDLILSNISMVEKMVPYISDCCCTVTRFEPCVVMHHIMETEQSPDPNIIITKDLVTMQVAAFHSNNTVIYRPKKEKGEDNSYVVIPNNNGLYNHIVYTRNIKNKGFEIELSPELYSFVLASTGAKSRYMKSLISFGSVVRRLEKLILSGKMINGYNSLIRNIYEEFDDKHRDMLVNGNIEGRFKAVDLLFQYQLFLNNPDRLYYKGIQNLYDPVGFHQIVTEYFKECPIDTERL